MKFRKKPVEVEAIRFTGDNDNELKKFCASRMNELANNQLMIFTLEGALVASLGDWVVKGIANEIYPVKPDIFEKTYERVEGK